MVDLLSLFRTSAALISSKTCRLALTLLTIWLTRAGVILYSLAMTVYRSSTTMTLWAISRISVFESLGRFLILLRSYGAVSSL